MPHGGHLRIAARNVALAEPKGLEGAFIAIDVEDTGEGIAPDVAEQIFEPFFTTKGPGKGTGLGLSQVIGFARQAGGDVRVRSTLGAGACFSLYLPRSDAAPTRRADTDGAPPEAAAATLLLVEDNPDVAAVASELLRQLGHRVRVAPHAAGALSEIEQGPVPDVVFSDIVMAGELNGLELARRVRARWPELPVLLTTGYSEPAQTAAGEFSILRKPYDLDKLAAPLARLIARGRRRGGREAASPAAPTR